jgi:hypothetical protein
MTKAEEIYERFVSVNGDFPRITSMLKNSILTAINVALKEPQQHDNPSCNHTKIKK